MLVGERRRNANAMQMQRIDGVAVAGIDNALHRR